MNLKKIIIVLSLFIAPITYAQDNFIGGTISYSNQSGNFGRTGLFVLFGLGNNLISYKLDANANMAYMRDNFHVIPEIGITGYIAARELLYIFPFIETEFTPYTITPKAGISLASFVDFGFGYGFKINEKDGFKPIKGFQFSIGVNIPFNLK
ncbi:hypothetical protein [Empedobacter tilapiae]|uniref:hypothetical protein n=1 Tax=Empedobacter tilapiae TaxID=2491114 RepID=UPI0028D188D9|nr:hypothetical protein [Empedobacter tilapiae]